MIVLTAVLAVGRPSVFTDTRDYLIHGARFYQAVRRTFLGEKEPAPRTPEEQRAWQRLQWQMHFDHSNTGARSPYYGIVLYSLAHRGTLWLLTAVQALCCTWLLLLLWRAMAPAAPAWTYYAMMAALAATTSLPWVASFAMPDIFAAVLIMAATLLLLYRDRLERWEKGGVWLLLFAAVLFHGSHSVLMLVLLAVGLGLGRLLKADPESLRRFAVMSFAALALAALASMTYSAAIQAKTGDEFRRPPFLLARVLADGPGRNYLRASCPKGAAWVICRFRNLPLDTEDHILWSAEPEFGVFNRSNYEDRVAMEKQEFAFVVATVAYDPLGEAVAALKNWGVELFSVWVDDPLRRPMVFLKHDYWGHTNLVGLIRGVGDCGKMGELCQPKVSVEALAVVEEPVLVLSLIALAVAFVRRGGLRAFARDTFRWEEPSGRATAAALLIGLAIVLNAGVCGVLAGPFPRYQARVVWLLPAEAVLLSLSLIPAEAWARRRTRMGADALDALWGRLGQGIGPAAGLPGRAWAWLRARLPESWRPAADRFAAKVDPAFLCFAMVGVAGFLTDTAVLYVMTLGLGLNPFTSRFVSFPAAVAVTWVLNRRWTFKDAAAAGTGLRQAAVYFGVQCAGFAANFLVYSAVLICFDVPRPWLVIPLAFGAVTGLCLTFVGSKHLAFKGRPLSPAKPIADTSAV